MPVSLQETLVVLVFVVALVYLVYRRRKNRRQGHGCASGACACDKKQLASPSKDSSDDQK